MPNSGEARAERPLASRPVDDLQVAAGLGFRTLLRQRPTVSARMRTGRSL